MDNADDTAEKRFSVLSGSWPANSKFSGYYGPDYASTDANAGAETARAQWTITVVPEGTFEVYARWPKSRSQSASVPFVIKNGATELGTVRVDQRWDGGAWVLLGLYSFDAGAHTVEIHDGFTKTSNADKTVSADAVMFVYVGPTTTSTTTTTTTSTTTTTLPPTDCIVDNLDDTEAKRFAPLSGHWSASSKLPGYYASNYAYTNTRSGAERTRARWTCTLLAAGECDVYAWWPTSANNSSNAPYVIKNGSTELATVRVDQSQGGGAWHLLGRYLFSAGQHTVEIHDGLTKLSKDDRQVCADAVRFVLASGGGPIPPQAARERSPVTMPTLPEAPAPVTTTTLPVVDATVDNRAASGARLFRRLSGAWKTNLAGRAGTMWPAADPAADYDWALTSEDAATAAAEWVCSDLPAGRYEVFAWWPQFPWYQMGRNVAYEVLSADGATTLRVDQNAAGGQWVSLGEFRFAAGEHRVRIQNGASAPGAYVAADAVRFLLLAP